MIRFSIGDPVLRLEDRPERRAVVAEIDAGGETGTYRIVYAEGGDGWWPEEALEADPSN